MAQDDAATRSVTRQLRNQGFDIVSVSRTLLGRVRIVSRRGNQQREIVLDPRNGAILRDYTVGTGGDASVGPEPEGSGGGSSGGEDDDDDDDDDDDGDDDGGSSGGSSGGDDDDDDGGDDDGDDDDGDDDGDDDDDD